MRLGAWLGLGLLVGSLTSMGCAAGGKNSTTGGGGSGAGGSSQGGSGPGGSGPGGSGIGGSGTGGVEACNKFTAEAEQAPAAMLMALDMSASMTTNNKWGTSQLAVVGAIDKDIFDTMSMGLVTFPTSFVTGPDCIFGFSVSCGVSALPQVAMAPAGKDKSNASMGVRHSIYDYLVNHAPLSNQDDGSPVYEALVSGYAALKFQNIDRRILVLITDGGFSCTSLSNRTGYLDLNGCSDWEKPDSVNQLIAAARTDPDKPIFTFIVGVPGSDSTGQKQGAFDTPPYHMKLALSTYAVSGSPDTVDPACSKDATFTQAGADPAIPCHIDLSGGASFNPDTLADAIQTIRGKALGCIYDLPPPPQGQEVDLDLVNVEVTVDGASSVVKKRSDAADDCKADGCWDYNVGNQVMLLGKTCDDLTNATTGKVDIKVGCETIVK